jgi:hypothetical protein
MSHQQNTFVPPTVKQRAEALGETDKVSFDYSQNEKKIHRIFLTIFQLDEDIRRALTVAIDDSFPSIPIPNEGDWLSIQRETGQTVKQFERSQKTRPRPTSVNPSFQ